MPFCPNCHTEYVAGTMHCADCGAELVEATAQPALSAAEREQWRPSELCEVNDMVQLDLVEAQLRAAGIPSVRRPRRIAVFVAQADLSDAQRVMRGEKATAPATPLGLSELHRVRLVCESCNKVTSVDLLDESLPQQCACGHFFELSAVRPMLDRYADVMRMMADADFEVELEPPQS